MYVVRYISHYFQLPGSFSQKIELKAKLSLSSFCVMLLFCNLDNIDLTQSCPHLNSVDGQYFS